MRDIILQVISSWQIWVVTIVLVIYISLVRYVARLNNSRYRSAPAPRAKKQKPDIIGKPAPAEAEPGSPKTDELGLEEGGDDVAIEQE